LKFDVLLLDLDSTSSKLDTDSQIVLLAESLVRKLEQQARLSDTCVANDDILEKVRVGHILSFNF